MTFLLQAARYSAAGTRVRALQARLLTAPDWAAILAAPDLDGIVGILHKSWYGSRLPEHLLIQPDASTLEHALLSRLVVIARRPFALLQGTPRALIEWLWFRYQLNNLKTVLRGMHHQAPPEQIQAALIEPGLSNPHWVDLVQSQSIPVVVDRLAKSWYGSMLRPALDQYRRQQSIFPLELALDLGYYTHLIDLINRLRGADYADATAFLGTWIDSKNLLWAYRYHQYARLSPEEILNFTLQRGLRVNAAVVRDIAMGAPLTAIVHNIWQDRLPGFEELDDLPEQAKLPQLELLLERALFSLAERMRPRAPLRLATILAYMFLLDYEVRDLIAVIEGRSFGWSADQISAYLIGKRAP
jgi:V/A-type H+-transporting ATPase subunit C